MKAAILTAGCRLNQAESDALRRRLSEGGAEVVALPAEADQCYINTCTVTGTADRSSVKLIRQACRLRPKPKVIVVGCLAERAPERVAAIEGVDEVWDIGRKQAELDGCCPAPARSRATLKVQDGCDRGCAFCVAATLRGRPVGLDPDEVLRQFELLLAEGFHEIVLSGLNLGAYRGRSGEDLARLVARLLRRPGRFRLRLGSLEPDTVTDRLLEVLADERVCPHFHLPLQSGDDEVLAAMGRRCDTGRFRGVVERLRAVRPEANIGIDVIAGLPGESAASFERTRAFIGGLPIGYLHAFPYSPRPGTRAWTMDGAVSAPLRRSRVRRLRRLSEERRNQYRARYVDTVRPAVVEPDSIALTDNYIRLALGPGGATAPKDIVDIVIRKEGDGLTGYPLPGTAAGPREVRTGPAGARSPA